VGLLTACQKKNAIPEELQTKKNIFFEQNNSVTSSEKNMDYFFERYIHAVKFETISVEQYEYIINKNSKDLDENTKFLLPSRGIESVEDYEQATGIIFNEKSYYLMAYNKGGKAVRNQYVGEHIGSGKVGETDYDVYSICDMEEDYIAVRFSNSIHYFAFCKEEKPEVNFLKNIFDFYGGEEKLEIVGIYVNVFDNKTQEKSLYFDVNTEINNTIWQILYSQDDKSVVECSAFKFELWNKYYDNITILVNNVDTGELVLSLKFNPDCKLSVNSSYLFDTELELYEELVKVISERCKGYCMEWEW